MAKTKKRSCAFTLGPGIHPGIIEVLEVSETATERSGFRVRLLTGERIAAVLGDGVDLALAEECLRDARTVMLADTPRGPTVLGALQTTRSLERLPDGTIAIDADRIRLRAKKAVILEAGEVSLRLDAEGTLHTEGERMLIDMSSNLRVLSALVELP